MTESTTFFHQVYQQHQPGIYRFAYWLCGNAEEAQDICSETFLRMWTASTTLKAETIKGYLLTIARNLYLQKVRSNKRRANLDHDVIDPGPSTSEITQAKNELKMTLHAMQELPEMDRTLLILKAYEGMSYREISLLMNVSVASLKVRVHRAREKLLIIKSKGATL